MATTPLVVEGGQFTLATVDFSDAIPKLILTATADEVDVPQTLATPKTSRKGAVKYEIQLDYFSNDTSLTTELFAAFWDALDTDTDGELDFTFKLRNAAVSASNPEWSGTLIVLEASLGGDVGALSSGSVTFPLTGRPARATS